MNSSANGLEKVSTELPSTEKKAEKAFEKVFEKASEKTNKKDLEATNEKALEAAIGKKTEAAIKKASTIITMSFAGDCTLGTDAAFGYVNSFPYRLAQTNNNYSYFFEGVRSIFETDDITLVNLETTLTRAEKPAIKKFRFKGEPSYVEILKGSSIEAVNIANNHTYDYLQKGFDETTQTLEKEGVLYSGWDKTAYFDVKDVKIAILGFTAWDERLKARIEKGIKEAKENAQIIIVSMHWGQERVNIANKNQKELAHFCIDNGANAVIGHHPHVIQGAEEYKGGYIAYSLGNFCFGGNSNPSDKDSFILRLNFEIRERARDKSWDKSWEKSLDKAVKSPNVKIKVEIIPCSISSAKYVNDYHPVVLEGADRQRVFKRIEQYSR